jgi:two-component system NtrC family sensor kinase
MTDEDQNQRVSLIIDELKRMARLLNELLDLSKHTPAPVVEFDLSAMIRDMVALIRYQIPHDITLSVEVPDTQFCRLPESRIRQCLLNLILNAAQAMGSHAGHIEIRVEPEVNGQITLLVADDGPGFNAEILQSGIRPFVTGKAGGTGLGLAMVQRFVRELGGHLHLEQNQPQGARVRLVIPARHA